MTSVTLFLRTFVTTLFRMAVHALLLCSDDRTAGPINIVLGELGISVERCVEVFAAVKKVTTERFDTVILDCQSLENARLLLKSTRASSQNNAAFAVAIIEAISISAVFQLGADSVLTKPIALGNVRTCFQALRRASLNRKSSPASSEASTAERTDSRHIPPTISGTFPAGYTCSGITDPNSAEIGPSGWSTVVTDDRATSVASPDLANDGVSQLQSRSARPEDPSGKREGAAPAVQKDPSTRTFPSSAQLVAARTAWPIATTVRETPSPSPAPGETAATINQNPLALAMPSMTLRRSLSSASLEERKTMPSEKTNTSSRVQHSPPVRARIRQKIVFLLLLTGLLLAVSYSQRAFLRAWLSPLLLRHWPVKLSTRHVGSPFRVSLVSGHLAIARDAFVSIAPSPWGTLRVCGSAVSHRMPCGA